MVFSVLSLLYDKGNPLLLLFKHTVRNIQYFKINIEKFFKTITHSYPDFDLTMHCYICTLEEFDIKLNDHISYKLLESEKLHTLDWVPADIEIVNLLKEKHGI